LIDYVQALVEHTRHAPEFEAGLSPRAALGLLASARAWAMIEHRDHLLPEDIQAVLPAVAGHRLRLGNGGDMAVAIRQLIEAVAIP
jgi:MoxR-like ATPase